MGLVLVILTVAVHGYDVLADPLGWLLVAFGVRALGGRTTSPLLTTAVVAGAISCALWFPAFRAVLHPSAEWALSLPELLFAFLLCNELMHRAGADGRIYRTIRWAFVVVAVIPVLVYGGKVHGLGSTALFLGVMSVIVLDVLLFMHANRAWAHPQEA
jgi:hypothetical protein